jgi:signal peptidase I
VLLQLLTTHRCRRGAPQLRRALSRVLLAALPVGALVLARGALLRVTVDGESMAPHLHHGDRVLAVRTPWARVRRGAVVVGRPPSAPPRHRDPATGEVVEPVEVGWFVKRVVGAPGDRVRPRHGPGGVPGSAVAVPPGHWFVEGDGAHSVDSGWWGPVPADLLTGVVVGGPRRPRGPR